MVTSKIRFMARKGVAGAAILLLLATLPGWFPVLPAAANGDVVIWFPANIPTEGTNGNWVLAPDSDIQHLTLAIDGTLYCHANPSGTSYTLFQSTDQGGSWAPVGKVTDNITAIATAPDNASVIYYATARAVYRSNDTANTFTLLPTNPGGAGSNNIEITCIAVTVTNRSNRIIACGTRDTDGGQHGGIYTIDDSIPVAWTSTNLSGYDVYAIAFSPTFIIDNELIAVVTDEARSLVITRIGDSAWGSVIGDALLDQNNSGIPTPVVITRAAAIAFPDDYDTRPALEQHVRFVAIDSGSGQGDVYRIDSQRTPARSLAVDLNVGWAYSLSNIDTCSVAVSGHGATANLLAGVATSAQTYFSTDAGKNWTRANKELTGQSKTRVVMPTKFKGTAYAATCGAESAFSRTADNGTTWNQLSLIDTKISRIIDLALSPNYSQDGSLFLLTHRTGGRHSLWRSMNGGTQWERVYSGTLTGVTTIERVAVSPQYGSSKVVYLAGTTSAPAIWQSTDNGQTFNPRHTQRPVSGASFSVDTWTVVNNTTLFVGSYDGSNGVVYHTTSSGSWYSTEAVAGNQTLHRIILSPNYAQDKTVLVGNTNGWVYWSNDEGKTFQPLPPYATAPPLTGSISVAFDDRYARNKTVYAASDSGDKGIYRYIIDKSSSWERIDGTLTAGGMISQLAVSTDGVLYATNFKANGGLERCLDPTYSLGPTFETVTRGLDDGATLTGLWVQGNRLWSMDNTNRRLMTYIDSLNRPISPTSPANKASGIGYYVDFTVRNISLEWEGLKGATSYQWQLDYDTNFSSLPIGLKGDTQGASARLPALDPASKYYWRVRATQPVLSPWSPTASFTTAHGGESNAPELVSPAGGTTSVEVRPIFQWRAVPWGHRYEILVATDGSFANPVIVKVGDYALSATAWQCDHNLNYNTTYYWKVRASGSSNYSPWSAVSAFTTRSAPVPPPATYLPPTPLATALSPSTPTPLPQPPPPPAAAPTVPDWVKYLIGALIVVIILQLVIVLVLVISIRQF